MSVDFDLYKVGKRMPYTTPDEFFDKLEDDIWKEVKNDCREKEDDMSVEPVNGKAERKPFWLRILMRSVIAMAACIALILVVGLHFFKTSPTTLKDVDQAFSQLTTDDQAYLLDIYQADVFINE